ncbi:unnamed protein product [Sphagnum troendelagicum]|uniref:Uncharacterized protein n=1 Tax=Sphagnum troendelagicum TaxID=128251 RepID=A0ABP0U5A8_9BRYO
MKYHPANRRGLETITTSIPWCPYEHEGLIRAGDWLANTSPRASNPLEWVYLVSSQPAKLPQSWNFKGLRMKAASKRRRTKSQESSQPSSA